MPTDKSKRAMINRCVDKLIELGGEKEMIGSRTREEMEAFEAEYPRVVKRLRKRLHTLAGLAPE